MSNANADKKTSNTKLNELEQIKKFTTVVADTADFESIREFKPQGCHDESQFGLRGDAEGELQSFPQRSAG
jgi:hypothetical protein